MPNDKIQFLIDNLAEGLDVEVKNWLGGLGDNAERAKLAKEIIALANHGGGFIFVGFEDEGEGHPEIEPEDGQLEAYSPDTIAQLIERYVSPPCQCELGFYSRKGSDIRHPVITVPGEHRTPVMAKRSSPDERTLKVDNVYVRRPGGFSEPARNQDDWEKLIERLVRARQSEQLDAIRHILNPTAIVEPEPEALNQWTESSFQAWESRIAPLDQKDARRLADGYWIFSFTIDPFPDADLGELNQFLECETPRFSGWRPFTYLHRENGRPVANGNVIEAWLARSHDIELEEGFSEHADFWRVSNSGKGFSLRPMQEDSPSFMQNRYPRPNNPMFDYILPPYRMVEFLKFVQALAERFSDENAKFSILLRYENTANRELVQHQFRYNLSTGGVCRTNSIESRISGQIYEIESNLPELIQQLLKDVFVQFDFASTPMALIQNQINEAFQN